MLQTGGAAPALLSGCDGSGSSGLGRARPRPAYARWDEEVGWLLSCWRAAAETFFTNPEVQTSGPYCSGQRVQFFRILDSGSLFDPTAYVDCLGAGPGKGLQNIFRAEPSGQDPILPGVRGLQIMESIPVSGLAGTAKGIFAEGIDQESIRQGQEPIWKDLIWSQAGREPEPIRGDDPAPGTDQVSIGVGVEMKLEKVEADVTDGGQLFDRWSDYNRHFPVQRELGQRISSTRLRTRTRPGGFEAPEEAAAALPAERSHRQAALPERHVHPRIPGGVRRPGC